MNRGCFHLLLATLLACGAALAQVSTGTLSGTVTDPTGAVVSGATITLRHLQTGESATWVSNDTGRYKAPFVQPGSYSVRVAANGFRVWEAEPIEIKVGKETVVNASLAIGEAAETIKVEGSPAMVESTTAEASVHLGSQRILHLPRLSAGLDRLALLAPGISQTGGNLAENGAVFSANGQRPRSNGFLLNGQDNSHRIPGGPRFLFGVVEAVSEYHVITNQFNAEYGLAQGSIVNVTTRGGTNQFHGILTWLHRNDAYMAALTNIQRRSGASTPPKFIENRFGGTLGGPIRKDKAFFFVYFDNQTVRRDLRVEATPAQFTPTAQGLRTLVEAFPNSNTVAALQRYGPLTRPEGNPQFLPGFRLDPLRSPAGTPVSVEMGRLVRYYKTPVDTLHAGARADFEVTSRNHVNLRYFHREADTQNTQAPISGYVVQGSTPMRSASATWTRIFSPAFVNEARFGYDYDVNEFADPSGVPYEQMGRNISEFGPPNGYVGFGLPNNMPQISRQNSVQAADNVSHHVGRHALKYGFQWNRLWSDVGSRAFYNGQFQFDTLQNFVDNRPLRFNGVDGPLFTYLTFSDQAFYFQDDFRVRPGLTLNLGIRYDVPSNFTTFASGITVPRESDLNTAIWNTALPIEARTNASTNRDWNNWAPRIGFAWSPRGNQSTVIRGGYGIAYDFPYGLLSGHVIPGAPLVLRYSLPGSSAPVPGEVTGDAVRRVMQPPRGLDPRQLTVAEFSRDLHTSMSHSWSFGIQQRLGKSQTLEVRYAGNRGIGLFQSRNANPNVQNFIDAGFPQVIPPGVGPGVNPACPACAGRVNPDYATSTVLANNASSTYHGLQTRYEGRSLAGVTLGAAYTWSRAIDNASDGDLRGGPLAQNPFDITAGERGPSAFDRTHVLALHFVWEMPGFHSQRGFLGLLLGGWSVSGIIRSQSGSPVTPQQRNTEPRSANDLDFNAAFGLNPDSRRPYSSNPRAPLSTVGFVQPNGSLVDFYQRTRAVTTDDVRWIYNSNAAARMYGTPFGAGRNVLRSPSIHQTDLSLFKNVRLTERLTLQLRLEAENTFNHPNLGIGGTVVDLAGFLNPTETQAAPRRLAAGLRIMF